MFTKSKTRVFRNFLVLISVSLIGCGGIPFPWPGDKGALKESCQSAQVVCENTCRDDDNCFHACRGGFNGCLENIYDDKPRDWQPADSFYDGCTDVCEYGLCRSGCVAGQNEAAAKSATRLRKYGVITFN